MNRHVLQAGAFVLLQTDSSGSRAEMTIAFQSVQPCRLENASLAIVELWPL